MDGSLKFMYASRASHYLDSAQRDRANKTKICAIICDFYNFNEVLFKRENIKHDVLKISIWSYFL